MRSFSLLPHASACVVALHVLPAVAAPPTPKTFADAAQAPAFRCELLALGQFGGPGDQWFSDVSIASGVVTFRTGKSFRVELRLDSDGNPASATAAGSARERHTPRWSTRIPDQNGGTLDGGIAYGYRQVNANLQQPFLTGKGWQLWGASFEQARQHSLMADSRIRFAEWMPNGNLLALGWCDGGNTVLHRDPRDLSKASPCMGYKFGGGRGSSVLLTEVSPQGEPLHQAFLGTALGDIAWDRWGRVYLAGSNLSAGGRAPFGRDSSGSVLVLSRDVRTPLLDARLGGAGGSYRDNAWCALAVDDERGLLALAGWTGQTVENPLQPVQSAAGGGSDGLYALIRLWGTGPTNGNETPTAPADVPPNAPPPPLDDPPAVKPGPRPSNPFAPRRPLF